MIRVPEYTDGCFDLYRVEEDTTKDFPVEKLVKQNMSICYRELSVFDRIKYEFEQGNKEITMKIAIPQYKGIDSKCVCMIEGNFHVIYNAVHVKSKDGYPETELTLIRPDKELSIS